MIKTYKYRLLPTKRQLNTLTKMLEECRFLYNDTLAYRKNAWENEQRNANWYETKARIPILKIERPTLKIGHSQVLQNVTERVDLAFKHFFRRVRQGEKEVGYPRFKGFGRYDSLTYSQSGFKLDSRSKQLNLSKVGAVHIVLHRPIKGTIKTLTITRSSTGKWYACFSVECEPNLLPKNDKQIGIDVGLTSFATLSDGQEIDNPRFARQAEKHLAKVQRKLSKYQKGTKERKHYRKAVAHTHERTRFKRQDFTHKESRKIVNAFGFIAVEDLSINRLNKNHCLAKSIQDAAWSSFFGQLASQAVEAGQTFVKVNPAYTSQTCHNCGYRALNKLTLRDRVFDCPCCNLSIDRDLAAALNIKALGRPRVGLPLDAPAARQGE